MVKEKAAKKDSAKPKKKKKSVAAEVGGVRIKLSAGKAKGAKKAKAAKSAGTKKSSSGGFDALAKLAEHPIIADLIAVGATAAVAAIAERGLSSKSGSKTGNAAKTAGKAAAAAIGKRLMAEYEAVKDAATDSKKA